jgi:hypothetical protein
VITVFDPLGDITSPIVSRRVGGERAHWGRLCVILLTAAAVAIGVVFADVVTPWIGSLRAGPRRIFVFRFGKKPIRLAGDFGQPSYVLFRVIPGYKDHWLLAPTPPGVADISAIAVCDARVPFVECQLELRCGKQPGD